mgnify:CR=1 FL=1|jgi:hypothetical protein
MRYWRLLGEYDAETTTFSAFAGGGGASPYAPVEGARLKGLRVIPNRSAATSLINHVEFRLTSSSFKPNAIEVGGQGSGLQTAPALQAEKIDWEVDQPVTPGVPITLEGRNITADTPVTVSVLLYGLFDNGQG